MKGLHGFTRETRSGERPITRGFAKLTPNQARKARAWACINVRCTNRVRKASGQFICETCKSARYAAENPIKIKWLNLKKSAKRRELPFELYPYEAFECWAAKYGYVTCGKLSAEALTVDRRDPLEGYTFQNIRCCTNSENARAAAAWRRMSYVPYYAGQALCPF